MNEALVMLLALLWALVLLPSIVRSRRSSLHVTVGGFERAMDVLRQRPSGRQVMVPGDSRRIVQGQRRRAALIERRRRAFTGLVGATTLTFLLAVIVGSGFWLLFGLSTGLLISYVALLLRLKNQRDQARSVVRELRREVPADDREPAMAGAPAVYERAVGDIEPTGDVRVFSRSGTVTWPQGVPVRHGGDERHG